MSDEHDLPTDTAAGEAPVTAEPDYQSQWLRAMADYQNLKKQTEVEKSDWLKFAAANLLRQLLPIANNFAAAAKHVPADQQNTEWVKGIGHIQKQFDDVLKAAGVEAIVTADQPFNPEYHEAVGQRPVDGVGPDMIIEEVQPGYTLHGKVLVPAKVVVSQ